MAEHLFAQHGERLLAHLTSPAVTVQAVSDTPVPEYVADFLVRLRLAENVPFTYLVPHQDLLPAESIRFFTVDEKWLDALLEGAMAVGAASTRDTDQSSQATPAIAAAVRSARPLVAAVRRNQAPRSAIAGQVRRAMTAAAVSSRTPTAIHVGDDSSNSSDGSDLPVLPGDSPMTGFLLRSSLVSGWPGMSVRAFTRTDIPEQADPATIDPSECVPILRLELLAPSVLLVLFSGTPALVWLEEPHHGIQLGIDPDNTVELVGPTGTAITTTDASGDPVPETAVVPMRANAPDGVIDISELAANLAAKHAADPRVAPQGGSAALALQLLRPPWRQRFSIDENGA